MQNKTVFKLLSFTAAIAVATTTGYVFGYNRGYSNEQDSTDDGPVISVPTDYLSGVEPVPYVPNGSFSFDTFTFTDDSGRRMAVPLPNDR